MLRRKDFKKPPKFDFLDSTQSIQAYSGLSACVCVCGGGRSLVTVLRGPCMAGMEPGSSLRQALTSACWTISLILFLVLQYPQGTRKCLVQERELTDLGLKSQERRKHMFGFLLRSSFLRKGSSVKRSRIVFYFFSYQRNKQKESLHHACQSLSSSKMSLPPRTS